MRKEKIESNLSKIIGQKVEVTVRGARKFTISTEEVFAGLETACMAFFGNHIHDAQAEHDDETGSFFYFSV